MSPCPFLPQPNRCFTHTDLHALGADRGPRFYSAALNYAQSLWLAGFPAKSLLLINRAFACSLPGVALNDTAAPYRAITWILQRRPENSFIGNPRRHYQHLATRMVEPHKELRTWRAWGCWYLARQILSESDFPPDLTQVRDELVIKPRRAEITQQLGRLSPSDDREAWEAALSPIVRFPAPPPAEITFVPAAFADIGEISRLAHAIWPEVYASIISQAQIAFMLEQRYSPDVLREDIAARGMHYALIRDGSESVGYLAWEESACDREAFLHKLYLLPRHHGRGIGAKALRWVEDEARSRGLACLRLRVNRRNSPAIRAYVRAGFVFDAEVCTEIGAGFVMDDFVMAKPFTSA
jgi:GNAT superfamily N-acetyltransferase